MTKNASPFPLLALRAIVLVSFLWPVSAHAQETLGIRSVTFSPDSKRLAATTGEPKQQGTITLWEIATNKRLWQHTANTGIPAVAFSPDGRTVAIGGYDNTANLLDSETGEVKTTLKHPKEVRGVAFSLDGTRLATACWDKLVRVWDIATATEKVTCTGHTDRIFPVSFSPDGKLLLSAAGDDGVKIWDASSGAEKRTMKQEGVHVSWAEFCLEGRCVATGDNHGRLVVWDVESGKPRVSLRGMSGVRQFAVSSSARRAAVAGHFTRDILLLDFSLGAPADQDLKRVRALLVKLDNDSYEAREAASKELFDIGSVAVAELQRAAKEAESVEVRIRARRLRQQILSTPRAKLRGHTDEVECVAFSPDGKLLASGAKDGTVRLWDLATLKETAKWQPNK
jgi:WD40 repeat protein